MRRAEAVSPHEMLFSFRTLHSGETNTTIPHNNNKKDICYTTTISYFSKNKQTRTTLMIIKDKQLYAIKFGFH
jgi:hypothetical protein